MRPPGPPERRDCSREAIQGAVSPSDDPDDRATQATELAPTHARARADSALAGLGGDGQAIWDAIAEVQKFDALVAGVNRKVETLQRITERRVQEAQSASDRRTAGILGLLTSLGLLSLATSLLLYFFGGPSDDKDDFYLYRFVFFGAGILLAVALWFVAFPPWRWHGGRRQHR